MRYGDLFSRALLRYFNGRSARPGRSVLARSSIRSLARPIRSLLIRSGRRTGTPIRRTRHYP